MPPQQPPPSQISGPMELVSDTTIHTPGLLLEEIRLLLRQEISNMVYDILTSPPRQDPEEATKVEEEKPLEEKPKKKKYRRSFSRNKRKARNRDVNMASEEKGAGVEGYEDGDSDMARPEKRRRLVEEQRAEGHPDLPEGRSSGSVTTQTSTAAKKDGGSKNSEFQTEKPAAQRFTPYEFLRINTGETTAK